MGNDTRGLPSDTIDQLTARLAAHRDLRLPAQLRQQPRGPSAEEKQVYLQQLLLHDPGVFLERHGSSLTGAELAHFQCLRGDYEVDFYCKVLEDQADQQKKGQVAKNRRLAAMNRLEKEGAYFSEKEMQERQPGLHHQYIGQYRPPDQAQGSEGCQAGNILAQSIMRQQEELDLRQRQEAEQQRWEQAEEDSEEEEEKGKESGAASAMAARQQRQAATTPPQQQQAAQQGGAWLGTAAAAGVVQAGAAGAEHEEDAGPAYVHIPQEEQQENAIAFLDLMRQRFLAGQDAGVDYAVIDADAELDDDWAEQAGRDAEDKYFDA